ncbi:MAG: Fic family protein [Candidatus Woesearchaeota archaeon]
MYSHPDIKKSILEKKTKIAIREDNNLYFLLDALFDTALESEALQHSLRIEYPVVDSLRKTKNEYVAEDYKQMSSDLKKAWYYGKGNFNVPFDNKFLLTLAYTLEPSLQQYRPIDFNDPETFGYRKTSVRPLNASVTPPHAAKLELSMDRFFKSFNQLIENSQIKKTSYEYCFDMGAWLHLQLARIHPFDDGNGRTARMIHNLYLGHAQLPPIVIREEERKNYIKYLDDAVQGFKNRDGELIPVFSRNNISEGERRYYDFMAKKLNESMDYILDKPRH